MSVRKRRVIGLGTLIAALSLVGIALVGVPVVRSRHALGQWEAFVATRIQQPVPHFSDTYRRVAAGEAVTITDVYENRTTNPAAHGYADSEGRVVIAPVFFWADESFVEGRAVATDQQGTGYIDATGAWVGSERFSGAYEFSNGMGRVWRVERDPSPRRYGFVDLLGSIVVPVEWDYATDYVDGYALVGRDTFLSRVLGTVFTTGGVEGVDVPRTMLFEIIDKSGRRASPP